MTKRIPEYVKYSKDELDKYSETTGSCVKKMNSTLHINILPSGLNDFKKSLLDLLLIKKIGIYDQKMQGIILDIQNIKLLGNIGSIRFDDPRIHVNIQGDCYVFRPVIGAIVRGTVRHISSAQIGVIIYRVFSVPIRLVNKPEMPIVVDSEIDFRIKKYNLENVFPYIEGELVEAISKQKNIVDDDETDDNAINTHLKKIKKEKSDESDNDLSICPPKRRKVSEDSD